MNKIYKLYKFFEFFIPFFWIFGGFVLVIKGIEIVSELEGVAQWMTAIGILFMSFGIVAKWWQEIGLDKCDRENEK